MKKLCIVVIGAALLSGCTSERDITARFLRSPGRDAVAKAFVMEAARRAGPDALYVEKQIQARGNISADFADAGVDLMIATCIDVGAGIPVPDEYDDHVKAWFEREDIAKLCTQLHAARSS